MKVEIDYKKLGQKWPKRLVLILQRSVVKLVIGFRKTCEEYMKVENDI